MSRVASKRCPCDPTYPIDSTVSLDSSRVMPKLYCAVYCARSFGSSSPNSKIGRNLAQSTLLPRGGLRMPLNGLGDVVKFPAEPLWLTNGVLKNPPEISELPPNGGSP